jgi:hypothetical protein
MTNKLLRNDADHWRTRAEEARLLAKETKASETKNALLRIGDNYEHLACGSKTGPCGGYQGTESLEPKEGHT